MKEFPSKRGRNFTVGPEMLLSGRSAVLESSGSSSIHRRSVTGSL